MVQAACNRHRRFIHMFVGFPGSVHDSRVFRNSPLVPKLAACPDGMIFYRSKTNKSSKIYKMKISFYLKLRLSPNWRFRLPMSRKVDDAVPQQW